jgi:hypothetical protein
MKQEVWKHFSTRLCLHKFLWKIYKKVGIVTAGEDLLLDPRDFNILTMRKSEVNMEYCVKQQECSTSTREKTRCPVRVHILCANKPT